MVTTNTTHTTTTTAPGPVGGNVPPLAQDGGGGGPPPPPPAAAAGGGGWGGGPPRGPPSPVVFARTPGELEANDLINYATREGRATFRHAIAEFPGDFKSDGNSANINAFHERLMQRAEEFGWNQGAGNNVFDNRVNSIKHYGRLTAEQLRNAATPYMDNASRQT